MSSSSIRGYFGGKAVTRDDEFERLPILGFEQRMRQRMLLDLLDLHEGERVVDVGCGNLRDYQQMVALGVSYFGVDLTEAMLREGLAKHPELRGRVVVGDATRLPLLPEAVDKIALSELIEHIPSYRDAIVDCARTVRCGGAVVVTTPNRHSLYGLARWVSERITPWQHPYDHWKTGREVARSLTASGLTVALRLGAVFTPYVYGPHIPRPIQRCIVWFGERIEPMVRRWLPSRGYLLGIRGDKR